MYDKNMQLRPTSTSFKFQGKAQGSSLEAGIWSKMCELLLNSVSESQTLCCIDGLTQKRLQLNKSLKQISLIFTWLSISFAFTQSLSYRIQWGQIFRYLVRFRILIVKFFVMKILFRLFTYKIMFFSSQKVCTALHICKRIRILVQIEIVILLFSINFGRFYSFSDNEIKIGIFKSLLKYLSRKWYYVFLGIRLRNFAFNLQIFQSYFSRVIVTFPSQLQTSFKDFLVMLHSSIQIMASLKIFWELRLIRRGQQFDFPFFLFKSAPRLAFQPSSSLMHFLTFFEADQFSNLLGPRKQLNSETVFFQFLGLDCGFQRLICKFARKSLLFVLVSNDTAFEISLKYFFSTQCFPNILNYSQISSAADSFWILRYSFQRLRFQKIESISPKRFCFQLFPI